MAIKDFNVSYPDFELDTIINPDEFDVNFADIMIRINQIIDVLNQITDGIGGDGSDIIDIGDVLPFTSPKLQGFLDEFLTRLQSTEVESGAKFIGTSFIPDVQGGTVQDVLESLRSLHVALKALVESYNDTIHARVDVVEGDMGVIEGRVTVSEESIATLQNEKLNVSDAYTREQTDTEIAHLESQVYEDMYTKLDSDILLDEKTDVNGNHKGTWQGINISDISNIVGASGVVIGNVQPANPSERMLWFNPSNNEYALYLNGQWRINTRPTQIKRVHNRVVLGADSNIVDIGIENFNPLYDAFIVHQNSTFIAEDFEYQLSADGLSILSATPWTAGTTFDFIAFIATPAN